VNNKIIERINAHLEKWPRCRAEQVPTKDEIRIAEISLGVRFSDDYTQFLLLYGGASIGSEVVIGLKKAPRMGTDEASVIEVTERFRKQHWPGCKGWYVVSIDERGNPVGLDNIGSVWLSDHDGGGLKQIASTLGEWIEKSCFKDEEVGS